MLYLKVTTYDLENLISKSEHTEAEKEQILQKVKDNSDEFKAEQVEDSLLLLFADESEILIKGVTMEDLFFTRDKIK